MDFSVSDKGYNRGPHRDRDSRVINFLIYLNDLKNNDGGKLFFYKVKKNYKRFKYPRFPNASKLNVLKSFPAKKGLAVFFPSSPDSYHSVSKFLGNTVKKRYFIYGSFSLNKPVVWKKNRR